MRIGRTRVVTCAAAAALMLCTGAMGQRIGVAVPEPEPPTIWRQIYMVVFDSDGNPVDHNVMVGGEAPSGMEGKADLMGDGVTWYLACPDPKLRVEVECDGACTDAELIVGDATYNVIELHLDDAGGMEVIVTESLFANPDSVGDDPPVEELVTLENDFCGDAICIGEGETVTGSTTGSIGIEGSGCSLLDWFDVWYLYDYKGGTATFSLCGSSFDPRFHR